VQKRDGKGHLPRDDACGSLARREGLRLAGRRRIATTASSDLGRGEGEHKPGRGVEERGNHHGFPMRKAQVKLTVAKALVEV
jgi:hypothetical protein